MYLSVSGLLLKNKVRERKGPRTCLGGHKMKGRIRALAFVSRIICTGNRPRIRMQGPKCLLPLPPPPPFSDPPGGSSVMSTVYSNEQQWEPKKH